MVVKDSPGFVVNRVLMLLVPQERDGLDVADVVVKGRSIPMFTLPQPAQVIIEQFDVQGRRLGGTARGGR